MVLEPDGVSYPERCMDDPRVLDDRLGALEPLRCERCGERRRATWKEARVLWFGLGARPISRLEAQIDDLELLIEDLYEHEQEEEKEKEVAKLREGYEDWCEWEKAAERLYKHLNPGKCWYEFPADQREEWIRGLQG